MKGKLKIGVKDHVVTIKGYLKDSDGSAEIAVIDSLLNAFGMTGERRETFCHILMGIDRERTQMSKDHTETKEA